MKYADAGALFDQGACFFRWLKKLEVICCLEGSTAICIIIMSCSQNSRYENFLLKKQESVCNIQSFLPIFAPSLILELTKDGKCGYGQHKIHEILYIETDYKTGRTIVRNNFT